MSSATPPKRVSSETRSIVLSRKLPASEAFITHRASGSREMTSTASAEFAIRPFIEHHYEQYDAPRQRKFSLFPGSSLAKAPPAWVLVATMLDTAAERRAISCVSAGSVMAALDPERYEVTVRGKAVALTT